MREKRMIEEVQFEQRACFCYSLFTHSAPENMPKLIAEGVSRQEFDEIKARRRESELEDVAKVEDNASDAFSKLFRFASASDMVLVVLGCCFSVISGCFMPVFALLMGQMLDAFADDTEDGDTSGPFDVRELGLGFVILGAVAFIAAFFQGGLLQVAAARQQTRLITL